ncbi:hypothetical protein AYM40_23290 [Paraburkholderia phytofirmans OLGA172]|uniref:Purine-nucleoside phosphorylase n=1 Tax=Paraburkholderia phytofirmans OLGA172 TaxID=1417228 RepID=A0A160FQU4_9BURK|nr:DUF4148 domain-containing protein [Paraburkholderia phytofirmans]ANB75315.1 hypothetical protein AYM40_23290 [Paraburkholderia phytofirmans OLGA172]
MKTLIQAVAITVALVAPITSFAQSSALKTRAEVRAELVQLEKAGYNPGASNDSTYPAQIQAAEARVAEQNGKTAAAEVRVADTSGVGGTATGSSASGVSCSTSSCDGMKPIYFGQ